MKSVIRAASPVAEMEAVNARTDLFDTLTQGLRLVGGIDLKAVAARHGCLVGLDSVFEELVGQGLLEREGDCLRLSKRGRLLANEVSLAVLQELGPLHAASP